MGSTPSHIPYPIKKKSSRTNCKSAFSETAVLRVWSQLWHSSNFSFSYCNVFSPFKSNKLREPGRNCGTCANATLQCMWLRVKWENKSFSDANLRNWCNGTPRPQTRWKHSKMDSTARHPNIQYLKMLFMGMLGFFGFDNFVDMMSYRRGWKWISQG